MDLPISVTPSEAIDQQALAHLKAIGGEDSSFLGEMIELFLGQVPGQLEQMQRALAEGNLRAVGKAAHHTKSSSFYLGARRMSALCSELEVRARSEDALAVARSIEALMAEFQMVRAALLTSGAGV
jgi:HPt (histidine-containing phosphotransfer) domain-containing protein